jgi:O-methyltransferase
MMAGSARLRKAGSAPTVAIVRVLGPPLAPARAGDFSAAPPAPINTSVGMRKRIMRRAVSVAKALGLARMVRATVRLLPARFRVRMESRVYDLRRRGGDLTAHVAGDELERVLGNALARLSESRNGDSLGDYLEFGVYGGGTMACFDRARRQLGLDGMRLLGFDSFEGLPQAAQDEAPDRFLAGMFACTADEARATLLQAGVDLDRVQLVEGWFDDTLTVETRRAYGLENAGVIMLDCDLYSSAKAALRFCAPLVDGSAIVVCDDWVHGGEDGEQGAFREFLDENGLEAEPLGHYRAGGHEDGGRVFLVSRV